MSENELGKATSPYLLQHKDNPVHWRLWGEARTRGGEKNGQADPAVDRLCGLSLVPCDGARELRRFGETAALMNELFVSIKVDREERPDIDEVYMASLHAMGQQGGWPLTMFLTPDGEPFWGGTYFPKEGRYGRPSFRSGSTPDRRRLPRKTRAHQRQCRNVAQRSAQCGSHGGCGRDHAGVRRRLCDTPGRGDGQCQRRHKRRPEISQCVAARTALARRRQVGRPEFPRNRAADPPTHLCGRHPRPSGRRICTLCRRRAMARSAFRENALRQCAIARPFRPRIPKDRGGGFPRCRQRRSSPGSIGKCLCKGALSRRASTPTAKASRGSSMSGPKRKSSTVLGADDAEFFCRHYDVDDDRQLDRRTYRRQHIDPQPARGRVAQAARTRSVSAVCGRNCSYGAAGACGQASTTRSSPIGTGL